jgi:hypothetical protein
MVIVCWTIILSLDTERKALLQQEIMDSMYRLPPCIVDLQRDTDQEVLHAAVRYMGQVVRE